MNTKEFQSLSHNVSHDNSKLPKNDKFNIFKRLFFLDKQKNLNLKNKTNAEKFCSQQSTPLKQNRFLVLVLCVIYVSATGSIYYGWPGFSNMLFRDEAYIWLCSKEERETVTDNRFYCRDQDAAVQLLFQIAMPIHYVMSVVAGTFIDNLGPRFTAVLGQSLNIIAWLILSFSGTSFNGYIIAFIFIGLGADTCFLPTLQTSNLFPGYNSVIIAILGAANSASFAVPTIMDAISTNYNLEFKTICYIYIAILAVMLVYAIFGFPSKSYKDLDYFNSVCKKLQGFDRISKDSDSELVSYTYTTDTNIIEIQGKDLNFKNNSNLENKFNYVEIKNENINNKSIFSKIKSEIINIWENIRSSKDQFSTTRFFAITFYFCLTSLILNFYIVSGEHLLTKDINTFFGILNPFSFVATLIFGRLADVIGPVTVIALNTIFGLLSYIFALIPFSVSSIPKYFSAIGMTVYISIYTSQVYFYIKKRFDDVHFGKLVGAVSMCGGIFSFFSVFLYDPVTTVYFDYNFTYISILMLILCLLNVCSFYFMKGSSKIATK